MKEQPTILVTGGTGYIGSFTAVALIKAEYRVIIADNLINSDAGIVKRIQDLTGIKTPFYPTDFRDEYQVRRLFELEPEIDGIIHFAAYKAVGESIEKPVEYYHNNLTSLIQLLRFLPDNLKSFIFSSSCSVYGEPDTLPVTEKAPRSVPTSPYGNTKKVCEEILEDQIKPDAPPVIALRYFNPIGALENGMLGEAPQGRPNNLLPYINQVAGGVRKQLTIYGNDYPTADGTCIRDYIHVMDVADAHVKALERGLKNAYEQRFEAYNLGTGTGYSVLEIVETFQKVNQVRINFQFGNRRPGDIASVYADPSLAAEKLGWKARYGLEYMLKTAWKWEQNR